jgi:hypothetical protein
VGFADPGRDSDRLQQLRRVLPCEVRVTSPVHPLAGRLLLASGFKRWQGEVLLVVTLPDGSKGTVPAAATDVLGDVPSPLVVSVLSVEGVRRLRVLLDGRVGTAGSRDRVVERK